MVGLWDSVTGFFSDLGDFFSGKDFFEAAGYAWNDMMKLAADVLTKNPSSGTYKDVWENISTIYTTLNVVAVSLLCIFFLYGFCRDSCDLDADLTFERTIKNVHSVDHNLKCDEHGIKLYAVVFYMGQEPDFCNLGRKQAVNDL